MSQAIQTYATLAKAGMPIRDLEASALLKAAGNLQSAMTSNSEEAREAALTHNRRLWTVFAAAAADAASGLPEELRASILTLSNFVFNQSIKAIATRSTDAFDGLIAINRELAAGLRGN
jgi:flagellar protein FlaF